MERNEWKEEGREWEREVEGIGRKAEEKKKGSEGVGKEKRSREEGKERCGEVYCVYSFSIPVQADQEP